MLKFRKGSIHSISPEFIAERMAMSGNINTGQALDIAKSLKGKNLSPAAKKKTKRGPK